MSYRDKLESARKLAESGDLDEAMRIANDILNENFDEHVALFLAGYILLQAGRFGMAYNLFKRSSELSQRPEAFNNMGMCYQEIMDLEKAESCFRESLKRDPNNAAALNNMGLIHVNRCESKKAIHYADLALKINPDMKDAHDNRGLACLQLRRWAEGWVGYEHSLGGKHRKERQYTEKGEPRWDGSPGRTVVIYGEQGLGDEINFASCIPDAINVCKKVIIDCDKRLEGMFKRSFPGADVYGTRYLDRVDWPKRYDIEASCAMGSLPKLFRNLDEDFSGDPYIIADPERRLQWRALLDSLGEGLKIGIAWTGGKKNTGADKRSINLSQLKPILDIPAHFISLQYKDPSSEISGYPIRHWSHGTITNDYDDTAALVSELDLVIGVTTSVIHLAGALGVPAWAMVPRHPTWVWGVSGERFVWNKSVKLYRQTSSWDEVIDRVANELTNLYRRRSQATNSIYGTSVFDHKKVVSPSVDHTAGVDSAPN